MYFRGDFFSTKQISHLIRYAEKNLSDQLPFLRKAYAALSEGLAINLRHLVVLNRENRTKLITNGWTAGRKWTFAAVR